MGCVPWEIDPGCCDGWDDFDSDLQERAQDLAWATLRLLTGGLVGHCAAVLRPCVQVPCDACLYWWSAPVVGAHWVVHPHRCHDDGCSCVWLSEVVLPGRVARVEAVMLDGAQMPTDTYRLDGNRLLRVDGGTWPTCQDMRLSLTEVGSFGVFYMPGVDPGTSGTWAAGVLACEYAKACTGGKCRLPASVVSVARQGVTMQFDNQLFSNGLTGIREVDAWVLSVNPHALKVPPRVWSPDVTHGRTTDTQTASR